jgi:DNA (cytosine-5)-methyltransferase 1
MSARQLMLDLNGKLIVDLFAGGGGMSLAFERAFGRSPDIAVNHNDDALSMHRMNHPQTRHFVADVFEVCPRTVTQGRPVGWLHGSPDCTHHSQAAGGQPRSKKIRGLGWVLPRWAGQVRPEVISMENVKQMLKWGPLVAKRDPATGRCLKRVVDAKGKTTWAVADKGERVPVQDQYLVPDKKREGQTWCRFVATFDALGYRWDYRVRCAADAGGHTTRTRLFFIARRDGHPITFPEPKFFKEPKKGQRRWKPAADCIDFSLPCRSIFERERPLAEATMKRIATGIRKFVLDNPKPFIVNMAHGGKVEDIRQPISTIATENGGCRALVAPTLVQTGYGEHEGQAPRVMDIEQPLGTVVGTGKHAVGTAILVGTGGPEYAGKPSSPSDPMGTVLTENHRALATAYLMQANGGFNTTPGHAADEPFSTVTNSGSQQQLVTAILSPTEEAGALRVAAFLMRYYGQGGQWSDLGDPLTTITTKDRMALVTVTIAGTPYVIVDIGLRMLEPRELYNANDFPADYIIDRGHDGRRFSKSTQVRMVGNSVDPVDAADFLEANAPWLSIRRAA